MLKYLIFLSLSWMTFSAQAQISRYDVCMQTLDREFLASRAEGDTVCRQNSTPAFLQCMVQKGQNTTKHILTAAKECSSTRIRIPLESDQPHYINLKSCPSKLQLRARMNDRRAKQICDWDSSDVMQNCLIDLVEKARFHSEHAIQYCGYANTEYRRKIPQFAVCVIERSRRGYDVYTSVRRCDDELTRGYVVKPEPRPRDERQPAPRYEPQQPAPQYPPQRPDLRKEQPRPEHKPEVVDHDQDEEQVEAPQEQTPVAKEPEAPKPSGGRKIPTPVEIKIEGTTDPEVNDQPIETGSTSNSESLPL